MILPFYYLMLHQNHALMMSLCMQLLVIGERGKYATSYKVTSRGLSFSAAFSNKKQNYTTPILLTVSLQSKSLQNFYKVFFFQQPANVLFPFDFHAQLHLIISFFDAIFHFSSFLSFLSFFSSFFLFGFIFLFVIFFFFFLFFSPSLLSYFLSLQPYTSFPIQSGQLSWQHVRLVPLRSWVQIPTRKRIFLI